MFQRFLIECFRWLIRFPQRLPPFVVSTVDDINPTHNKEYAIIPIV